MGMVIFSETPCGDEGRGEGGGFFGGFVEGKYWDMRGIGGLGTSGTVL
jgi:hypothetical protein